MIKKDEGEYSGWEVYAGGKNVGYLFANIEFYNKLGTKKDISSLEKSAFFFGNTI